MRKLILSIFVVMLGCQADPAPAPKEVAAPAPVKVAEVIPTADAELPGQSIYQLEGSWTTQDNKVLELESFRGKPVVAAMFFGSCRTACPTIIADMKRIEKAATPEAHKDTQFVLITFDPKVDTPEALKELETKFKLDGERWTFLHGDAGSIREVAAVLNVQYREVSDGQFSHTNLITLLDPNGVAISKIEGLKMPVEALVASLNKLVGDS